MSNDMNGWSRAELMVMKKLEEHDKRFDSLESAMVLVRIDVARLKVKSGLWGAVAGAIPALIGVLLILLTGAGGA